MTILVMGVMGAGKTTVGRGLAERLGWDFLDADDFHPAANREKMARGQALSDADRQPWLSAMALELRRREAAGANSILACSALKKTYRSVLLEDLRNWRLVFLRGSFDLIQGRLAGRQHAFAQPSLLASQFETLEIPETALAIDVSAKVSDLVEEILKKLALKAGA